MMMISIYIKTVKSVAYFSSNKWHQQLVISHLFRSDISGMYLCFKSLKTHPNPLDYSKLVKGNGRFNQI